MTNSTFKIMRLTEAAANRIKDLRAQSSSPHKILCLGVKNGGCAGMSYTLEWVDPNPSLDVVEDQGVSIAIEPKAVLFLLGTEMDYQQSTLSSGFVFNNPNQTSACGCGESVALAPASEEQLQKAIG
jgi:iron-sulfur cluster assembly protein